MKDKKQDAWWRPAMVIFARVSAWIAIPIVISLIVGKYIDKQFNSAPFWFLTLTGLAFIVSMVALVKISKDYIRDIEKPASTRGDSSTRGGEIKDKKDGKTN